MIAILVGSRWCVSELSSELGYEARYGARYGAPAWFAGVLAANFLEELKLHGWLLTILCYRSSGTYDEHRGPDLW